jgi:hypothetical protein
MGAKCNEDKDTNLRQSQGITISEYARPESFLFRGRNFSFLMEKM